MGWVGTQTHLLPCTKLKCRQRTMASSRRLLGRKREQTFSCSSNYSRCQTSKQSSGNQTSIVDCVWNVMAHAQKPDFVFRRNGRVHLNRQERQFSPLLAAEVRAWAVVMLDTPCSEVVWRVLTAQSIRQFPLHFPSRASPCAITFQLDYIIHPVCLKP